jgi:hypothetical protein
VLIYLDDILVMSSSPEEHERHLREVLHRLHNARLYCKLKKCHFNKAELPFLGHVVGRDGIRVDPRKTAALKEMPAPTNVSGVRSFLGLAQYFRRFLHKLAERVAPLTELTSPKTAWRWGEAEQQAFDWVKEALSTPPVLAQPDFAKPFVVTSDASNVGIAAVLEQDERPVAFESRKLSPAEQRYTTTEAEMLAVVYSLRTWRCYLEGGGQFLVRTDHNPNTYFDTKPELSRREARWQEYLSQFDFRWQYLPGKSNLVADALSRAPIPHLAVMLRPAILAAIGTRRSTHPSPATDRGMRPCCAGPLRVRRALSGTASDL